MKKTIFFLIALWLTVWLLPFSLAFAGDAGACYAVGSPDLRAYCRAKAHKDPSICYEIHATDIRAMCLAEVRK